MKTVVQSLPQAGITLEKLSYCIAFRNVYLIPTRQSEPFSKQICLENQRISTDFCGKSVRLSWKWNCFGSGKVACQIDLENGGNLRGSLCVHCTGRQHECQAKRWRTSEKVVTAHDESRKKRKFLCGHLCGRLSGLFGHDPASGLVGTLAMKPVLRL